MQVAPRKHLQGDGKCSKGRQSIKAVSLNKFPLWETDFYSCHRTLGAGVDHTQSYPRSGRVRELSYLYTKSHQSFVRASGNSVQVTKSTLEVREDLPTK